MPTKTNPAAEIHALCQKLKNYPGNRNGSVRDALASFFSVPATDAEFYSILSALSTRFDKLAEIIPLIPQYGDAQKRSALSATTHLKGLLHQHIQSPWESTKANVFKPETLLAIHMVDPLVQQIAPIAVPSEDERKEIIAKLDEAVAELDKSDSFAATSLSVALQAVRKIMEKLEFFGVEELLRSLINADAYLRATVHEAKTNPNSEARSGLRKAAIALSFVFNILILSDSGFTALENDYSRAQALLSFVSEEIKVEPLQLPPPAHNAQHDTKAALSSEPESAS